jgi:XTP/dITP diphosphohydrolase/tetrapyrrole methylase family protein/MazG family protein
MPDAPPPQDAAPQQHASAPPARRADGRPLFDARYVEGDEGMARYADFLAVVRQLRRDCPWDRAQTHDSVKHLLIEEAYEVVEAIDEEDWDGLRKELGDLFLHVLFHGAIAEENGTFAVRDVVVAETAKLVRRHPHVFGDAEAADEAAVKTSWEQIKRAERAEEDADAVPSALDGVPRHLPALLRAQRVQEKAAGVGFDFSDARDAWLKVEEELSELRVMLDPDPYDEAEDHAEARTEEFGDVLFALVNYARFLDTTPETALQQTTNKFMRRFRHVEQRLHEQGRTWDEVSLADADALWDEAKTLERLHRIDGGFAGDVHYDPEVDDVPEDETDYNA